MVLAEYGAFEILAYRTFTTEIFTEFQVFNVPTACALSLVLVALGIVVLGGDLLARGKARLGPYRPSRSADRSSSRLGRAKIPVLVGVRRRWSALLSAFPSARASIGSSREVLNRSTGVSLFAAGWHTALYSGVAAALATLMALPVALLALRHSNRVGRILERSTYLVLAIPGVVIASRSATCRSVTPTDSRIKAPRC